MSIKNKLSVVLSFLAVVSAGIFLTGFHSSSKSKITIQFENFIGADLLKLETGNYKNALGQPFTVSTLKYYISGIHLKRIDGKDYISHQYFLVDESELKSKIFSLSGIPEGDYSSMQFTVGIDSLHNCSGLQKGALDPVKGMFWAWNTGYIFLKFDGHSPQSLSTGKIIEYHIGGFQQPHNCIRTVTLPFVKHIKVGSETSASVKIKTDISKLFNSKTVIDFSKISTVTTIVNSTMIADNYATMFSVLEIK